MKSNTKVNTDAARMINYIRERAARKNLPVSITVKRSGCPVLGLSFWVVVNIHEGFMSSLAIYFAIRHPIHRCSRASVVVRGHRFTGSSRREIKGRRNALLAVSCLTGSK